MKAEISKFQRPAEFASWDAATGIKKLEVSFGDSNSNPNSARAGQIYANGNNQICVIVRVQAQDSSNRAITNPSQQLQSSIFSALYLVNRADMSKLDWNTNAHGQWWFTTQPNAFLSNPSGQQVLAERPPVDTFFTVGDDGTITYVFYVLCPSTENRRGIGIAAAVFNVPDGHSGTKTFDCAGNTSGIAQSIVTLAAKDPQDFSASELQTSVHRQIDNHRPPGRDDHDYLDIHTWTAPSWITIYSMDWANGSSAGECSDRDYYRRGVDASWLIYGSVYLPNSNGNGSLSARTYSRFMGDCLIYNLGGFNGKNYNDYVYFDVTVQANQIVVNKVIGTGFSFYKDDWDRCSNYTYTYVDVVDNFGTRRRLRFAPITTTDEGTGPQITSQVIRS